jgi:hypothetical protein
MGFNRPFDPWDRERAERRRSGNWLISLVLIAIGALFLIQNAGISLGGNWWALFILIPAIGCGAAAWGMYERAGHRFIQPMSGPLTGFVILTFITAMFFFSLSWSLLWPVFIIIAGLAALIGRIGR